MKIFIQIIHQDRKETIIEEVLLEAQGRHQEEVALGNRERIVVMKKL